MITNDYKVTVIKVQEIEKKWRGNLTKTMGLVKLRFPPMMTKLRQFGKCPLSCVVTAVDLSSI